jgi:hypothetical protein
MKRTYIFLSGILFFWLLTCQPAHAFSGAELQVPVISEKPVADKIKIYPNPTEGRFHFNMAYEGSQRVVAKVYDLTGKLIKDISDDLVKTDSSVSADVDLDQPRSGIYFLRIEIGSSTTTKKIIVK